MGRTWNERAGWLPCLPAVAAFAYAAWLTVAVNVFFMRPTPAMLQALDEGYVLAFARRMLEGQNLPYVDAVSHRGPLFYWIAALAVKLFGFGTWMPARATTLVCMLLTVGLAFAAASIAGRSIAGAVMALVHVAVCASGMPPKDGLAFGSEHVLTVFAMAALLCMTWALRRGAPAPSGLWVAMSGALAALCTLTKQVGLVTALPLGLWLVAVAIERRDLTRRARIRLAASFALGLLAPFGIVVARYAASNELDAFEYCFVTYNATVYGPAIRGALRWHLVRYAVLRHFDVLVLAALPMGWALSRLVVRARPPRFWPAAYAARGFDLTVAVGAGVSTLVANASLRDFGHYYLQALPWVGLTVGVLLHHVVPRAPVARLLAIAPLVLVTQGTWYMAAQEYRDDPSIQGAFHTSDWPICSYLRDTTTASDSIFMWGFDAAPYTACNRRPASRFVYTTFVAGFVPWIEDPRSNDDARATPGARQVLLDELLRDKPAVIFDSAQTMGGRSVFDYDELAEFVRANYCRDPVDVHGSAAWVRKPSARCR